MFGLRLVLVLSLFLLCVNCGFEFPCTHTSASGQYYDLSTLSKCDSSGYTVASSSDGPFLINFCNSVSQCGGNAAVCQKNSFDCGVASSTSISDIPSGQGVVLKYTGGDSCPNNAKRSSIFTVTCDSTATEPQITFVSENPECTYNFQVRSKEACPKTKAPQQVQCNVNVFLVPHTHDDVGWLQTVEGYYNSQVKHIIDTSLAAVVANPARRFIYVEQAYFTLWWNDPKTSDQQRQQMKQVVSEGRWEFIIGSWTMPDEACTTYGTIIDGMTIGHQFLLNTFGAIPKKGWQIDPFGASSALPVLEKLAGFDAHLIDRITDKGSYESSQRLEFNWQGSTSLGTKGEIYTEIMGGGGYCDWYGAFNFDRDPVNPSNVASYGQKFVNMAYQYSAWYKTPNVLAEWGCDFGFQNATADFHSMDQVVNWLQANVDKTGVIVKYSLLSDYYTSVWDYAKTHNIEWPSMGQTDFFPYLASLWWTGYYTSRTELKGWVRVGEAYSHVVEPLYSLGRVAFSLGSNSYDQVSQLRVANGYATHHDGVSGTSEPNVVLMFQNYIIDGISAASQTSTSALANFIQKGTGSLPSLKNGPGALLNINNGQTVPVILFNSLGWTRSEIVMIPVNRNDLTVLDSNSNKLNSQITAAVGGNITSKYQLFFPATVPSLGYATFFIQAPAAQKNVPVQEPQYIVEDTLIANSIVQINISSTTNLIGSIKNLKSGVTVDLSQTIQQYTSKNSGAYAFGPAGPSFALTNNPTTTITRGAIVDEITTTFNKWAKQTIRVYHADGNSDIEEFVEIWFDVGPLPSHVELISLFSSSINSQNTVYSDDNGYEFLGRKYESSCGIECNYYPHIYAGYIADTMAQLSVISERSQGISSQKSGSLEVMIHRNPDMGDGFGPGLTDTTEVYPVIRVVVDSPAGSISRIRKQSYLLNFPLSVFTGTTSSASSWTSSYKTSQSLLSADLSPSLHLASVNALDGTSTKAIVRLTHIYATGDDPNLSKPVSVTLSKLFSTVSTSSIMETTLSANQNIGTADMVTISPKEVRTFVISFSK